jgi:hypothetical protein
MQTQTQIPQNQIPQRFRENAFRRYEKTIATFIELAPSDLIFEPRELDVAFETAQQRLRDAIRSLYTYKWTSQVNMAKFLELYPHIKVGTAPGEYCARVRVYLESNKPVAQIETKTTDLDLKVETDSEELIDAMAVLIHYGILRSVFITTTLTDDAFQALIPHKYTTDVTKQPGGWLFV